MERNPIIDWYRHSDTAVRDNRRLITAWVLTGWTGTAFVINLFEHGMRPSLVGVLVLFAAALAWVIRERRLRQSKLHAALVARAESQDRQFLEGDPTGLYGPGYVDLDAIDRLNR